MKMHLVALAGLVISSALPTFGQQKEPTPSEQDRQWLGALLKKFDDAWNNNDAAVLAALYTDDAVIVTNTGPIYGRDAIERHFADLFKQFHFSNHLAKADQYSPQIVGTAGNEAWSNGVWSATLQGPKGDPVQLKGYWSDVNVREGDTWKDRVETWNISPAPATASSATAQEGMKSVTPDELVWKEHPVLKGAQIAILAGDPAKAETIVQRVKFPPNFKVPPHTHPYSEVVTVLSGTYWNAMGDDTEKGVMLKPGSVFVLPANHTHRVWTTDEEVIIQINFTGPGGINFINPADDPRNK